MKNKLENTISLNDLLKLYEEFHMKVILGLIDHSISFYANKTTIYFHISNINYINIGSDEYSIEELKECQKK